MANPTLYDNFSRVKEWSTEKFVDKVTLAATLSDVACSGNYNDLNNKPDLTQYTTYAYVYSYVADAISSISPSGEYATEAYVVARINEVIDGAPAALDTLNELAAAINDDANFAGTITTALSTKVNANEVYTKTEIQNMGYISSIPAEYITDSELSACGYITSIPAEYITETELSACGYATALTQAQMDALFPINS